MHVPFRHTHNWTVIHGSGFGRGLKLRYCERPGCTVGFETYMYDIHQARCVWVPGNFMEDMRSPIFIVADDEFFLKEIVQSDRFPKNTEGNPQDYIHVRSANDLGKMMSFHAPRFILARDWKETPLSDSDSFRILCNTGHF